MQRTCWIFISVLISGTLLATEEFPYEAYVTKSSTTVLSGPGVDFYSCDRLELGDRVEVYRHDDEWAAIRPPSGCFSWVPATAVESTEIPDIITVNRKGVRTRIGSRFSDNLSAEYMPLERGESLEVLGRKRLSESPGGAKSLWYKVVPVSGEFRWVRRQSISTTPPSNESHDSPELPVMLESVEPPLPPPLATSDPAPEPEFVDPESNHPADHQSEIYESSGNSAPPTGEDLGVTSGRSRRLPGFRLQKMPPSRNR